MFDGGFKNTDPVVFGSINFHQYFLGRGDSFPELNGMAEFFQAHLNGGYGHEDIERVDIPQVGDSENFSLPLVLAPSQGDPEIIPDGFYYLAAVDPFGNKDAGGAVRGRIRSDDFKAHCLGRRPGGPGQSIVSLEHIF